MENFTKGDTLKLSKEGIEWLCKYRTPKQITKAKARRFEFRSFSGYDTECITVKRIRGGLSTYYEHYHESFLERA